MTATLVKTLRKGNKTIHGEVLRRGLGTITLAVIDKNGSKSVKTFKESDYVVRCH